MATVGFGSDPAIFRSKLTKCHRFECVGLSPDPTGFSILGPRQLWWRRGMDNINCIGSS